MSLKKTAGNLVVSIVATVAVLGPANAQQWQQTQPAPPAYPANAYPPPNAYPAAPPQMAAPPKAHPIRDLFVGTLAAIIQGATGGAVNSITQGVTGSITNWFDRKGRKGGQQFAQQPYYPATDPYAAAAQYPQQPVATTDPYATAAQYPQQPVSSTDPYASGTQYPQQPATTTDPYATGTQYPQQPATTTDPYATGTQYPQQPATTTDPYATGAQNPQYPNPTYPGNTAYSTSSYGTPTQVYDPRTGQLVDPASTPYAGASAGSGSAVYAGFAYEVHALGAGNVSMPINAATHQFRSGERFMVHFRPSLPGRMDVFNINPFGQQTRIDSVNVAAGQLTSLGPYEFAGTKGDESLRLVLAPCSTPQLLTTTRDIVNVSQPSSGGIALSACGVAARSVGQVRTRDIQKVAVDGGTSYALDPVSQGELSSGDFAAREVTIVFHHN